MDVFPWLPLVKWLEFLRCVDVGLQCSFSESFNYVAIEHLAAGVPVVGSSATRYLPKEWQADPERPEEIADKLESILNSEIQPSMCREIAERVAAENNMLFHRTIEGLLQ